MRRWISAGLAAWMIGAPAMADAADYVGMYGSYYLEQSTRIVSPMVRINKDLPENAELSVSYLIDQITSASSAFNPADDSVFQEYRHEVRVGAKMKFLDVLTPSASIRYSDEPDYRSLGGGAGLSVDLNEKTTTLSVGLAFARDWVPDDPDRPTGSRDLDRRLWTLGATFGLTQVLSKVFVGGVSFEPQILRGYQENQYRVEQHPRDRERYAFCFWGAYRFPEAGTTIRLDQRVYTGSWKLNASTTELRVTQALGRPVEVTPFFRLHFQDAAFFGDPIQLPDGTELRTSDPRLGAYNAQTFGLQISWKLSFLNETALEIFEDVLIQPSYAYLRQTNRYGNAHIGQLGAFWPF